ncbi:hypothetical protein OGQ_00796 [Enterococcus faecium EnGen0017]|nr:hypothetical protein OGQ_00796 [Enterococcus faecium EnGen0017]
MSIYTCTMNLAIDLFIETDEMHPFMVNRTKERMTFRQTEKG